jgi:hypothetical protein
MKLEFSRQIFENNTQYQISWKSVQWEPTSSMRADGRTDMTKPTVVFSQFCEGARKATRTHKERQRNSEAIMLNCSCTQQPRQRRSFSEAALSSPPNSTAPCGPWLPARCCWQTVTWYEYQQQACCFIHNTRSTVTLRVTSYRQCSMGVTTVLYGRHNRL